MTGATPPASGTTPPPATGSGTTSAPAAPAEEKQLYMPVDQKASAFGRAVLARLGHDVHIGRGDPPTLAGVLDQFGVKDSSGKLDLKATADALFKSLNELVPDKAKEVTGADGKPALQKVSDPGNDMLPEVQAALQKLFVGSGATNATELATAISKSGLQLDASDPSKKETLFSYLYRMGHDGLNDFQMSYTGGQIEAFREFLNSFTPGLGNMFMDMIGKMGLIHETTPEATEDRLAREELAEGFEVMNSGSPWTLAKFWGNSIYEIDAAGNYKEDLNGNRIPIEYDQSWQAPGTHNWYEKFFGAGDPDKYALAGGAPQMFEPQNFETMILARWEKQGVVKFASGPEGDAARQQFIDYAKQVAMGGQVGQEFVDRLLPAGQPDPYGLGLFDSEPQGLLQFVQRLPMQALTASQAADQILQNHFHMDPGANKQEYRHLHEHLTQQLESYTRADGGLDFAQRMIDFADATPGVEIGATKQEPKPGPSPVVPNTTPDIKVEKIDPDEKLGAFDYGGEVSGKIVAGSLIVEDSTGQKLFEFSDKPFDIYSIDLAATATGQALTFEELGTQMTPELLREKLGEGFKVQLVTNNDGGTDVKDNAPKAYYFESADGKTSFYAGINASIPEGSVDNAFKERRAEALEDKPENTTASRVVNPNATVDGQAPPPDMLSI